MTKIDGYQIVHTAGDTLRITLTIRCKVDDSYVPYEPSEGDIIVFQVKDTSSDDTPLIEASIPTDTLELTISASEMATIEARKAPYPYTVKITMEDGTVDTFIKGALFIIE